MSTLTILNNQQPKLDPKKILKIFKNPRLWLGLFAGGFLLLMIVSPLYVHFYGSHEEKSKVLPVITEAPIKTYQEDKVDEDYVDKIVGGESKLNPRQADDSIGIPEHSSSVAKEDSHFDKTKHSSATQTNKDQPKSVTTPNPPSARYLPTASPRDYSLGSFVSAVGAPAKTTKYPAGTILHVRLAKPVNSSDTQSRVLATIIASEGESFEQAKVIGSVSSVRNETRISVTFKTLILPSGQEIGISGHAQDDSGETGIPGYIKKSDFSNTVVSAIGQGAAIFAKEFVGTQVGSNGSQVVDRIAPSSRSTEPTNPVLVDAGQRFQLFLDEGVSLP